MFVFKVEDPSAKALPWQGSLYNLIMLGGKGSLLGVASQTRVRMTGGIFEKKYSLAY